MALLLTTLLDDYLRVNVRIRQPETVAHYRRSLVAYERWLARAATTDDLNDDALAAYLRHVLAAGARPATANQRAKQIRALWTWAAKRRIVDQWPTLPRVPEPEGMPRAYSLAEVARLLDACAAQTGWVGPYRAGEWWHSLHLVLMDTGERIGALTSVRWQHVDYAASALRVPAELRKGRRRPRVYRLRAATLTALTVLQRGRDAEDRVFETGCDDYRAIYRRYRRIVEQAGLPWTRRESGFAKLRRTVLTQIELRGGDAQRFAGHSDRRTTEQSYLDAAQLLAGSVRPWPPESPPLLKQFWSLWRFRG